MLLSAVLSALCLTLSASAFPAKQPTDFYLVTTSEREFNSNSSLLANVSATTVFDPDNQYAFLLRQIGPGYNSLPIFNLTDNTLETLAYDEFTQGNIEYNSTSVEKGRRLRFLPQNSSLVTTKRSVEVEHFGLKDQYLLGVDGVEVGWTVCPGPLGETVVSWKGTAASCEAVYIQAVAKPPY